jgi:hypothetical protein
MSIAPAFVIFIAAVALLLVTVGIACIYGRKPRKRQVARRQDTERGIKISAPILAAPAPARMRNTDGLQFVPTRKGDRRGKVVPPLTTSGWF